MLNGKKIRDKDAQGARGGELARNETSGLARSYRLLQINHFDTCRSKLGMYSKACLTFNSSQLNTEVCKLKV